MYWKNGDASYSSTFENKNRYKNVSFVVFV